MKTNKNNINMPVFIVSALITLCVCSCATSDDNRPIPGTVESTDTKKSEAQNNTPRTNPTPNPEPDSQPAGPGSR